GLARIFELQGDLEKAKAEYKLVTGGFAASAENRIKELEKPGTKETYAWLATAEGPRTAAPLGPGVPGQQPQLAPGEIGLPAATPLRSRRERPVRSQDSPRAVECPSPRRRLVRRHRRYGPWHRRGRRPLQRRQSRC